MKNGFRIIDSDLHLEEPYDLWERLPEPYRSTTRVVENPQGHLCSPADTYEIAGETMPASPPFIQRQCSDRMADEPLLAKANVQCTPDVYVEGMGMEGIDVAILVPTRTFRLPTVDNLDPQHAVEVCRVYNDWAHEFVSGNPERFRFWGWLPRQAPELAAREAQRCVKELGAVGVAMVAAAVDGHLLSDPSYDPLWETVDKLDVPLGLHVTGASHLESDEIRLRYQGHPDTELSRVTFSGFFPAMSSLTELIFSGVLDRYPKVKPVIMEVGAGWLLWLLQRMDGRSEMFGPYLDRSLSMRPSEFFRRQCYVTIEPDEHAVKHLVEYGLGSNLLLSTDYPHPDCPFPNGVSDFLEQDISDDAKRRIGWDNGAKLFGLSLEAIV